MSPLSNAFGIRVFFLAAMTACAAPATFAGPFASISDSEKLTAVSSSAHNGYVRTRQADGSFKPETFAYGNGGVLEGFYTDRFLVNDPTIDNVSFDQIAEMLSQPLASQGYIAATDPNATKLLILVFWGRTIGGNNYQDGNMRDLVDYDNAKLLGFDSEPWVQAMSDPSTVFYGRSLRARILDEVHSDVRSAVEVNRYYVILRAYDFQAAWHQRKLKLLWETRFSLSERRHDFERDLPAMARDASLYFGQDTYGIVLKPIPEGSVHVGEATPIDEPPDEAQAASFDPRSGAVGDWQRTSPGPMLIVHIDATGRATFESPKQHVSVPAQAATSGGEVTVKVPGWGIIIQGTVRGDRITGTIFQYDSKNTVTLRRIDNPDAATPER